MNEHTLLLLLLDVALVIVVARVCGRIALRLRQPAVVGEIAGGIALGPSLLGALPGDVGALLFPDEVVEQLSVLAQLGLVLFMFIVGLELDLGLTKGRTRLAASISGCSVVLPFALGFGLAFVLYPSHAMVAGVEISRTALALFLGTAMSITAFPVLARILSDRGMQRTVPGVVSLAAAAIDDVIAWSLLAFVVAVIDGGSPLQVLRIVGCTALFAVFMFVVVRPLLRRMLDWRDRAGRLTPDILAIVLIGLFCSAAATSLIGVHAIFGAFLFGAAMPRAGGEALTREILERLEQISVLLLLPMFFVITGLHVDLGGIPASGVWQLLLILAVAMTGKFVGAFAGARWNGLAVRQSAAVGVLMNTRGLTELVILRVGLELGVLDEQLFAMLVVMALVTTVVTEPLLRWVYPDTVVRSDIAAAERNALGPDEAGRVLILVDDPSGAPADIVQRHRTLMSVPHRGTVVLVGLVAVPERASNRLELGSGTVPDLAAWAAAVEALTEVGRLLPAAHSVRVLCRFSTDPAADLANIVAIADAEHVAVTAEWLADHPDTAARLGPALLFVTTESGEGQPGIEPVGLTCRTDDSRSGRSAVVEAARLAVRDSVPLRVVVCDANARTRRRIDADLAELRNSGFDVVVGQPHEVRVGDPAILLPSGVIAVQDRSNASETRLDERLRNLVAPRASAALERI